MVGMVKVRFRWWVLGGSSTTVPKTLIVVVEVLVMVFVRQTLATTMITILVLVLFFRDRMTIPQVRTANVLDDVAECWGDRLASVDERITRTEWWSATAAIPHKTRSAVDGSEQGITEVGYGEILVIGRWLIISQSAVRVSADLAVMLGVVGRVWAVLDGLYSDTLLLFSFATQTAAHAFIPFHHASIRMWRKAWSREDLWERFTRVWVFDIPLLHRLPQKLRVFVRSEKKLHSLPHDPSFNLKSGHNRVSIAIA
jgi:hypothetical protein